MNAAHIKGTQTVARAMGLLKQIANRHPDGIGIGELAESEALDRATAYRLASSLVQSGLAERDATKTYRLGIESMLLGLAAMRSAPIVARVRPAMQRLARRTEDTVFLVVRNGDYGHCLHCEEGSFPVKALVLQVGGMRVLGIGSAGVTLLSMFSDDDVEALYARHAGEFGPGGPRLPQLKRLLAQTRDQGFANTDSLVTEGVSGVGMSFEISPGNYAAVSVAAISSRMHQQRKLWIAQLIAEELTTDGFAPTYC